MRHQHIGLLEIAHVDRALVDEAGDLHRLAPFRRRVLEVLFLQHDVVALVVLEGLDDLLPRHFLAGLGIDALVAHRGVVAAV
jgi:hypothetical protein